MRAVRYERGAIRKRTVDLRERETLRLEKNFDSAANYPMSPKRSSRGIQFLIKGLEDAKQEVLAGTLSEESREWLDYYFSDEFSLPDETEGAEQTAASLVVSPEDRSQMVATIDEQLRRLAPLQEKVAAIEALNLDAQTSAAALPGPAMMDKLMRYETSDDRALDRALRRLEGMQARRRKPGGAPAKA